MRKRLIINIILILCYPAISRGQETLIGLQTNRLISKEKRNDIPVKSTPAEMVELPFFDDFSQNSFLPSPKFWSDNYAFINNTYSDKQPTMGMATVDALDDFGKLYETTTPDVFEADHLTSQPINLNYLPADNVFLTFFYQPGGFGDVPEPKDSLTVQFFAPLENKWYSVWRAPGAVQEKFKPAVIRIENQRYLKTGFRFRFVNWSSLNTSFGEPSIIGNSDHWNIDYVYLNRNRNEADTTLADVAFRTPVRSLLKTHESMPWKQFSQVYLQEMGSSILIHYRNNDKITRNITRNFVIRDIYRNLVVHSFSAGAVNIDPYTDVDYNANLIYTFNSTNNDSALFKITSYLKTDDFDPKQNDTMTYYQVFSNYFAFDDGTPEAGYGINGQGSRNAMVAYRFKSFIQDTLRALRICFNDSYMNSNQRAFDIMVWDDNNGLPGNLIYSMENVLAVPDEDLNGYTTYKLPDGVMIDGTFYIGWRQRSETFLNVGFDVNTPHKGRQFYWLNGVWYQSQKDGTIMIRPVSGAPLKITSAEETESDPPIEKVFGFWPNPASDHLNLKCDDPVLAAKSFVSIIDLQGREYIRVRYSERIDISFLRPGIYTVLITADRIRAGHFRLVKTR